MTSEELELSLKAEFENYLNGTIAAMRQDVAEFQKTFEAEFAKHRSQMEEALSALAARYESAPALDRGFSESVVEHLRLARDEGAQLAASAFSEAEKLQQNVAAEPRYDRLLAAVSDIGGRMTQVEILSSLIEHAVGFAPRGAFFIVKGGDLMLWKAFGETSGDSGDLRIECDADTVIGEAVRSAASCEGSYNSHSANELFLGPLSFGRPDRMHAIPLVARGRAVAVLYADYGISGVTVNSEALEAIVRVAGLTVELRAAAKVVPAAPVQQAPQAEAEPQPVEAESSRYEAAEPAPEYVTDTQHESELAAEADLEAVPAYESAPAFETAPVYEPAEAAAVEYEYTEPVQEAPAVFEYSAVPETVEPAGFAFTPAVEPEPEPVAEFAPAVQAAEPAVELSGVQTGRTRLSERNIDLPIEVTDEERKLHNNARRFARLLVSEIKLYNEQKVSEGREAGDLYDRLREAIDRSREMYDRRVEPQVAAKFDYFHYELLNDLAQGDSAKLGSSYPGAAV